MYILGKSQGFFDFRRFFDSSTSKLFCSFLFASVLCNVEAGRPNFVVFIVDDLGIGDIGCFGNDTIKTPNIDSIASQGVRLNHNLAPYSMCTPSRAATLTGRYAVRSGFAAGPGDVRVISELAMSGGLPANEITLAEILRDDGYRTGLIGKWHLGLNCENNNDSCHNPINAGFQEYYGLPFTNVGGICTRPEDGARAVKKSQEKARNRIIATLLLAIGLYSLGIVSAKSALIFALVFSIIFSLPPLILKMVISRMECPLMRDFNIVEQPVVIENLTVRFTEEAKSFVRRNKEHPFLLFMCYIKVHTSLFTSPKFKGHSVHGNYGDNVEEMDWSVGEIISSLRDENLLTNTMVYFTSDHGPHLEETMDTGEYCGGWRGNYTGGKGQSWEGGIRVPTAVMWKDKLPEGITINEPTNTMDIFTTMTKLAGSSVPEDRLIDGKDIFPLLKQEESVSPHEFMFHYCGSSIHAVRYRPRDGNITWKAHFVTPIWSPGKQECEREDIVCGCFGDHVVQHDPPLLYDITNDPYESNPLETGDYKDVILKMKEATKRHKLGVKPVPSQLSYPHNVWRSSLQPCCNFPYCTCVENS
ncbi:arylsulfatase E-like [Dendronephthya gigantea]|uniref:arylsulfatase E-like n=1 Tax=Dendronephthya gigantea TaxID=151771 RepID=UPI00106BC900|nr:arylsulfatase E-like [Dendronephthya gigantea]